MSEQEEFEFRHRLEQEKSSNQPDYLAESFGDKPKEVLVESTGFEDSLPEIGKAIGKGASKFLGPIGEKAGEMGGQNLAEKIKDIRRFASSPKEFLQSKTGGSLPVLAGMVGGQVAGAAFPEYGAIASILGAAGSAGAGELGRQQIGKNIGTYNADNFQRGKDTLKQMALSGAGQAIGKGMGMSEEGPLPPGGSGKSGPTLGDYVSKKVEDLGDSLKTRAENNAVAATGGTRSEVSGFKKGTGRGLLDKDVVNLFSSPSDIAENAASVMGEAESKIGDTTAVTDRLGIKATPADISEGFNKRIQRLKSDPATIPAAELLEKYKAHALEASKNGEIPLSKIEQWKRGYKGAFKNPDFDSRTAAKGAYLSLMDTTESKISKDAPPLLNDFLEQKKVFGMMEPVEEAASNRGLQLQQSPKGGFMDMAAGAAGAATGGPVGAVTAPVARRMISPRVNSMAAVSLDKLGDVLKSAPEKLGKYAAPLMNAANKGPKQMAVIHYLLGKDPNYLSVIQKAVQEESKPSDEMISIDEAKSRFQHGAD